MIFVTVGTHEQQFNRLIEKIDKLIESECIKEEVIIQSGFSTYNPKNCKCQNVIPYTEMVKNIEEARIVITHGGPATFIMPLQLGKVPIVVPRKKKYDEHVNDHQVDFVKLVKQRYGNIILVEDIDELNMIIQEYDNIIKDIPKDIVSNNEKFNIRLNEIIKEVL